MLSQIIGKRILQQFKFPQNHYTILIIILSFCILAGTGTGYLLASGSAKSTAPEQNNSKTPPKNAQQDNKTFRDFAEGKIAKKPDPKSNETYSEGTHLLIRKSQNPVALTSSVVDLSQYENKEVKVFGETQKAIKEGWLMDVGRVEEK